MLTQISHGYTNMFFIEFLLIFVHCGLWFSVQSVLPRNYNKHRREDDTAVEELEGASNHFKALFSSLQNSKILQDSPSHRIFQYIHEVLNIAK